MSETVRRSLRVSLQTACYFPAEKRRKISVAAAASTSESLAVTRDAEDTSSVESTKAKSKTTKKKRKKVVEEPSPSDYPRVASEWKFGAHVSAAGGVENAVLNAAEIGANAFALFLKSQRKWSSPALSEESISLFKTRMAAFGYDPYHVLPHGSYLINLGNPDADKRQKSYDCFLDDLRRCELLGLPLYNFHPGSTVGSAAKEESFTFIAECLNRAHKETTSVITVIENMAGAGNVIGSKFAEIARIIEQVEDKGRIGVCLDTCHAFAAGYDIRTREGYEATRQCSLKSSLVPILLDNEFWLTCFNQSICRSSLSFGLVAEFDTQIGLRYLRALHLNDSKAPYDSNRDRHDNIGLGHLTLMPFALVARDTRLKGIPLVLETPISLANSKEESPEIWRAEISMLNRLSAIDYSSGCESSEDSEARILEEMVRGAEEVVGRKCLPNDVGGGEVGNVTILKKATGARKEKEKGKRRKLFKSGSDETSRGCSHD
ncbi:xylose isomerase-like protein [Phellopilus nigrolimitatus]|nr:xylose isomerase-like protein [Phellopilus nigrolimitatus]